MITKGGARDVQTTSTFTIVPTREDDGAKYKCVVYNRAMPDGQKLESTLTLNVHCKYILS